MMEIMVWIKPICAEMFKRNAKKNRICFQHIEAETKHNNNNCCILMQTSMKFVLRGPIYNKSVLIQMKAWGHVIVWANDELFLTNECHRLLRFAGFFLNVISFFWSYSLWIRYFCIKLTNAMNIQAALLISKAWCFSNRPWEDTVFPDVYRLTKRTYPFEMVDIMPTDYLPSDAKSHDISSHDKDLFCS